MTDDSPEPRTIAAVLDSSAIAGFVRGSIAVGELIALVGEEHGAVLVPLPCLIEVAAQLVDGHEWLDILIGNPVTIVTADNPDDWRMIAGIRAILGSYEAAVAAWLAIEADVDVLTRTPDRYLPLDGGAFVLPFDD